MPIVAVGLKNLREHGLTGPVFFRFGRDRPQPVLDAIGNPRLAAVHARDVEEAKVHQASYQAQLRKAAQEHAAKRAVEMVREAAQREASRPVCAGCGCRFTDERWEAAEETDWGVPADTHPQLCESCKHEAVAAHAAQQEQPESLPDWAQQKRFLRFTSCPSCTECKAAFTDERWMAVERTGWDPFLRNATRRCARPAPRSTTTPERVTSKAHPRVPGGAAGLWEGGEEALAAAAVAGHRAAEWIRSLPGAPSPYPVGAWLAGELPQAIEAATSCPDPGDCDRMGPEGVMVDGTGGVDEDIRSSLAAVPCPVQGGAGSRHAQGQARELPVVTHHGPTRPHHAAPNGGR
ncbi:hypothetical protein ACIOGT_36410 [Streptomyces microflavus]|uniref:hypothetical protein n=1 Tax=Streptomyces microflavus TaxID=1919 RepID=UPI003822A508